MQSTARAPDSFFTEMKPTVKENRIVLVYVHNTTKKLDDSAG